MIREAIQEITEKIDYLSQKDLEKRLKKYGDVPVIAEEQDVWINIERVEDGIAYGIDQFDDDREIDLSTEKISLA